MKAKMVLPFDPVTRITTIPEGVEGVHISPVGLESKTVICCVQGSVEQIEAMKGDPAYLWLEDIEEPEVADA